jgi:hypothetical protein
MLAEAAKNDMSTVLCSADTTDPKQAGHTTASTNMMINNAKMSLRAETSDCVHARREGEPRAGVAGELEPPQRWPSKP